jgi:hypothetical protein
MKKKFLLAIAVVVALLLVWLLYPTEERRLKNDIKQLRKAVENESIEKVGAYIDVQYRDNNELTRDELIEAIDRFFAEVDSISVQMKGLKVIIDSTADDNTVFASCSLGVRVLARYGGERVLAFGGIVKPGTVKARMKKTEDTYEVYYAEY